MKFLFIVSVIVASITIISKLVVTDQENQIKILKHEIDFLEIEIESIQTDLAYTTSPQNLKEISKKQFNHFPIFLEDQIKVEDYEE